MKKLGYKQQGLIEKGKEQGFVTLDDVRRFYQSNDIYMEMSKLAYLGYFKEGLKGISVVWIYLGENVEKGGEKNDVT